MLTAPCSGRAGAHLSYDSRRAASLTTLSFLRSSTWSEVRSGLGSRPMTAMLETDFPERPSARAFLEGYFLDMPQSALTEDIEFE